MDAVVFQGSGRVTVVDVPEPAIRAPGDALVRVALAAISGADVARFERPVAAPGLIPGHEFVGEVVHVGADVTRFVPGDRVVGAAQICDGSCPACVAGAFHLCLSRRVLGGSELPGAQSGLVRVPYADVNLLAVPVSVPDRAAIWVGDVLTTGWYAAVQAAIGPASTVVVLGGGPVGLCAGLAARTMGGEVVVAEPRADRRFLAAGLGLRAIDPVGRVAELVALQPGHVLECVGSSSALRTALTCCRGGGIVSVVGIHHEPLAPLPLRDMSARALRLSFGGPCNVQAVWEDALAALRRGSVDPLPLISYEFPFSRAAEAYRLLAEGQALKVLLRPS